MEVNCLCPMAAHFSRESAALYSTIPVVFRRSLCTPPSVEFALWFRNHNVPRLLAWAYLGKPSATWRLVLQSPSLAPKTPCQPRAEPAPVARPCPKAISGGGICCRHRGCHSQSTPKFTT